MYTKYISDITHVFVVFVTVLPNILVHGSRSEPSSSTSSYAAEIIQSTNETFISFNGVIDNDVYVQVSNSYRTYTIDAVPRSPSTSISKVSKVHVVGNVTGKYSELLSQLPDDNFFIMLDPQNIIMTDQERNSRNVVILNQDNTFLRNKQGSGQYIYCIDSYNLLKF